MCGFERKEETFVGIDFGGAFFCTLNCLYCLPGYRTVNTHDRPHSKLILSKLFV